MLDLQENEIQVKKPMLEVFSEIHPKTGKPTINWEYGAKINAYFLVGVLEDIKLELLSHIEHESEKEN